MNGNENWGGYRVILASASPRRKELLNQIGIEPEIRPSHMAEETGERKPDRVVMELSRQKAEDIAAEYGAGTMVIGADTVVAVGSEILGKPGTPMKADEMIDKLQGRTHQVYTGVTLLIREKGRWKAHTFHECTDVSFYPVTEEEIKEYVNSKDPMDKAGSYGIQGAWGAYVKGIRGDYNNVVGLPVARLIYETKKLGMNLRG